MYLIVKYDMKRRKTLKRPSGDRLNTRGGTKLHVHFSLIKNDIPTRLHYLTKKNEVSCLLYLDNYDIELA